MSRRIEALKLEFKKANALMLEVNVLFENEAYNSTIHTLYYACFHATKALLLTKDLVTKTHKGVATLLNKQFVQADLFEAEKASFFKSLMDKRVDSDYGDALIKDEAEVKRFIKPAKEYFLYVTKLVEEYLAQ